MGGFMGGGPPMGGNAANQQQQLQQQQLQQRQACIGATPMDTVTNLFAAGRFTPGEYLRMINGINKYSNDKGDGRNKLKVMY